MSTAAIYSDHIAPPEASTISKKGIVAAIAGNALEFYDFVIYAYFAVYIGRAFFPVGNEYGSLLASVATFGIGFFTRPLGGILIGTFADKAGRKPAMILTVALITIGTLGIAATPGYATIGIAAPIIVVACRLLQGLALGGEVGPATSLLIEAAPNKQRGFYASWQIASQGLAVAVGGGLGVMVTALLSPEDVQGWGWRLPFLFSLVLIPIAVYIRRGLPETLERKEERSGTEIIAVTVTKHRRYLVLGILMMAAGVVSSQIGNYMTSYAIQTLKVAPAVGQASALVGGVVTFASALAAGLWCDRSGRKIVMILPRVLLMLAAVPMFLWLDSEPSAFKLLSVSAILAALTGMSGAASLVTVPELMPIAIRSTGTSLIYAISATLFGGTTQFVITWLLASTGDPLSPAYYLAVTSVISLLAMLMLPETRDFDVRE